MAAGAQCNLGLCFLSGEGVPQDQHTAMQCARAYNAQHAARDAALQHIKHAACCDPVYLPIHTARIASYAMPRATCVHQPHWRSGDWLTRCSDEPAPQCPSCTVPPPHPTPPNRALRLAGGSIRRRSKATRTRSSTSPLACCGSTRQRRAKRCPLPASQRPDWPAPCCSVSCQVPSGARAA